MSMSWPAEEDHTVVEQRLAKRCDRFGRQDPTNVDPANHRADVARDPLHGNV
jgi:hypothetical protein